MMQDFRLGGITLTVHPIPFHSIPTHTPQTSIAIGKPSRGVYIIDGDGALLMHMGNMSRIGTSGLCNNIRHIVINNGVHDSVGQQETKMHLVDIPAMALANGYKTAMRATNEDEIIGGINALATSEGPSLLEILVKPGARKDLGRPTTSPLENVDAFRDFLNH